MRQEQPNTNGNKVLVALGSNAASDEGDPRATVQAAIDIMHHIFNTYDDFQVSKLYSTPAFPPGTGPDFVNAACSFHAMRDANGILQDFHGIEDIFGRKRTLRWGQRTLDIDLIAHGQAILPDLATYDHWRTLPLDAQKTDVPATLILPHPRLQDRAFVLVPLADVAPDWVHPTLGQSVSEMVADLTDAARAEITLL